MPSIPKFGAFAPNFGIEIFLRRQALLFYERFLRFTAKILHSTFKHRNKKRLRSVMQNRGVQAVSR